MSRGTRSFIMRRVPSSRWFPVSGRAHYHADPKRSRAICIYAVGAHRQLGAISFEAAERYAARWKWDVVASCEPELADGRPASWAKVRLVIDLLRTYEWVWVIDADALIVDVNRDLFEGIDVTKGPIWLARHPQRSEGDHVVENAGVMLIRATPSARRFLEEVWACTQFIDHNWWENAAILHLIGRSLDPPYARERTSDHAGLISELPIRWNTVPGYIECQDAAIHHHARADHDSFTRRLEAMEVDLEKTIPAKRGSTS